MAADVFIDTSGFYALLAAKDDRHCEAVACVQHATAGTWRFLTTDYVLDETATILKVRGLAHLLPAFFAGVENSRLCRVRWTDAAMFAQAKTFFLRHGDKTYSFSDCVSFCTMRSLGLHTALTKDSHFQQAGFTVLLDV